MDETPASCLQDQPVRRVFGADITHSRRSGLLAARIQSARQEEYANQNIVYPEGLTVRRYKQGRLFFFLRADRAYYTHDERTYEVYGAVRVKNLESGQEMNTESLVWDLRKKEIRTDAPVSIFWADEVHESVGLRASEDFESYTLFSPRGDILFHDE